MINSTKKEQDNRNNFRLYKIAWGLIYDCLAIRMLENCIKIAWKQLKDWCKFVRFSWSILDHTKTTFILIIWCWKLSIEWGVLRTLDKAKARYNCRLCQVLLAFSVLVRVGSLLQVNNDIDRPKSRAKSKVPKSSIQIR